MLPVNTNLIYSSSPLLPSLQDGNALLVTDARTSALLQQARNYSSNTPHIELEEGEECKTLASIEKILKKAADERINREGLFIGVGGGVVLDMTGFAASVYMRGIQAVYVPTTLLAMVDAAIGGKTGVDFSGVKNLVGTFHLPKEVYICPAYLKSLSSAHYRSGLAEMLKIALINRPSLYCKIAEHRDTIKNKAAVEKMPTFIDMLKEAIEGKIEIVEKDFEERGIRSWLNLGHTFAHALEAALNFRNITHGEAVAWGISRSLSLGVLRGETDESYKQEVMQLISSLGYCTEPLPQQLKKQLSTKTQNEIASFLIDKMKSDKKNKNEAIRIVLQKKLGYTFTKDVDESEIREVLV